MSDTHATPVALHTIVLCFLDTVRHLQLMDVGMADGRRVKLDGSVQLTITVAGTDNELPPMDVNFEGYARR